MASYCLLIFARNSNEQVSKLVNNLKGKLDEIVIIDSSGTENHTKLKGELANVAKIYRVVPIGATGLLRTYASTKIESEYVLNLDCDEDPTDELIRDYRLFDKDAAYLVGWYHVELKEQVKKLILYRNDSVRWIGHVFEVPVVTGSINDISGQYRILHYANMGIDYLKQEKRRERYFLLESIMRPPTWNMLLKNLHLNFGIGQPGGSGRMYLSQRAWRLAIIATYFRRFITQPKNRGISKFLYEYGKQRLLYFSNLNTEQKLLFSHICEDIYKGGGLTIYLQLHDPEYVENLTSSYNWQEEEDVMIVAKKLIMYRYLNGAGLKSFGDFPYSMKQLSEFWQGGTQELSKRIIRTSV